MKNITQESFGVNIILMSILNLYPPQKLTFYFKIKAYSIFLLSIPPVPVFGLLYFLTDKNFSNSEFNENAFLIAEMACQVTKFLPFVVNGTRIKKCINFFESSDFVAQEKRQKKIINKCCGICKRNSRIFLWSIIAGVIFFAVKPVLIGETQKLPADVWLPFDPKADPVVFICVYMFIVFGVAYASFACAAIDPMIGGLVCLATGQLRVLKDNLQYLNEYAEKQHKNQKQSCLMNRSKVLHLIISRCVIQHNAILRFVYEYEMCFSVSAFSQIMRSTLVICFSCLQISNLEPMSFDFISMITYLSIVLAQIYVYCYYGTLLFEESNSLTNAIYMGTWYECDVQTRKSLIVLMERSKRPLVITVGKILELSVKTFTTILRRSYSLLAVLQNF